MMPGETILSGAPDTCGDCGVKLTFRVLHTPAGYYIGTQCDCGPYSRESDYYETESGAQADLDAWDRGSGQFPGWARS